MESSLTTPTAVTLRHISGWKQSSLLANKPFPDESQATPLRIAFLKARLLELVEWHRQSLRGLTDLTVGEFVNMQREMSAIHFELGTAA